MILAAAAPALAQEVLDAGERIRIKRYYSDWIVGTYLGVEGDSVKVQVAEEPGARLYRRPNVYRVQVDAGRRLSYTTGAMLGFAGGLGAGFVIAAVVYGGSDCLPAGGLGTPGCEMKEDDGEVLPVLAASAAVGVGIGLLTAKLLGYQWNDVALDALASAPGINTTGTSVSLTLRW